MEYYFKTAPEDAGARLDTTVHRNLPDFSRSSLKKIIESGGCRVDGIVNLNADARLAGIEEICIDTPDRESTLKPEKGELKIIWHDESLVVCDKSPGLVIHPCPSCPENTLVHRLLAVFPELAALGGERPGIVHRLDKDTSGLLLVALTERARLKMVADFAARRVKKEYLALVAGKPPASGECTEPLGRHPTLKTKMAVLPESKGGKPAHTRWRKLWSAPDDSISLLAVRIFSGRTHQIRVHMSHAGYPILGDTLYAPAQVKKLASRQMLHAWKISLKHPQTGKNLNFNSPPPEDFLMTAKTHAIPFKPIVITGSQGCGKSSFCAELEKSGIDVISADALVGQMYSQKGYVTDWLEQRYGTSLLNANGSVNKTALFEMFQKDPVMRTEFEKFVHNLVRDEIEKFWQARRESGQRLVAAEVPLFFESGWDHLVQPKPFVIGIHCPEEERWQRIKTNRGWSGEKIKTLEQWQWPESRKLARCDYVVDNSGFRCDLASEAQKALAAYLEEENVLSKNTENILEDLCKAEADKPR